MQFCFYCDSGVFWDVAPLVKNGDSQDRKVFLKTFLSFLLILPFALAYKLCRSFFRLVGFGLSFSFLIVSLGCSEGVRRFFLRRVSLLAFDLADWILYPLSYIVCLFKLLLAVLVHPVVRT